MNLTDLYDAILNGKLDRAVAVTNEAISEGVLPNEIITNYMIKAMEDGRFQKRKFTTLKSSSSDTPTPQGMKRTFV